MSRGKRYDSEPKLNIKKVIAVIMAIIAIVIFIIAIKELLNSDSSANNLVSTTYFLVNKNNKWGVIDNNAKIIIEPTYSDAIIIPNNKKDVFICTYDSTTEGEYKTKVINAKNKEIFKDYEKVFALENYDENYNLWYEESCLKVEKDGKYGLIDFEGNEILECNFSDIYTLKGTENSIITVKDEKLGLVDEKGNIIVQNQYDEIKSLGEDTKMYIVKENDKYGINNTLECKYDEIKALNNKEVFCVKENEEYKVINKIEDVLFEEKFDEIISIDENIIVYKYKNQYSAFDLTENKKLEKEYNELKYTANNLFIAKIDKKYGIINTENEIKVEAKYDKITFYKNVNIYELETESSETNIILDKSLNQIAEGIVNKTDADKNYIKVWQKDGYKYFSPNGEEKNVADVLVQNNLFLNKVDGKYGFVDKNGTTIVENIYDDAKEQNEFGYIAVKKNGLWGVLNKNGEEICAPKYNLDDNLLVDFIGEYHLGKDINLMYYTDK